MEHITIAIPDGLDERQKADLIGWLSMKAAEASPQRLPFEDDPQWQAETARRIRQGMADIEAGRTMNSDEAQRRLAERCRQADAQ